MGQSNFYNKLFLGLAVSFAPSIVSAGFYTVGNPWTGKPDYVSSNTVLIPVVQASTFTANFPSGVVITTATITRGATVYGDFSVHGRVFNSSAIYTTDGIVSNYWYPLGDFQSPYNYQRWTGGSNPSYLLTMTGGNGLYSTDYSLDTYDFVIHSRDVILFNMNAHYDFQGDDWILFYSSVTLDYDAITGLPSPLCFNYNGGEHQQCVYGPNTPVDYHIYLPTATPPTNDMFLKTNSAGHLYWGSGGGSGGTGWNIYPTSGTIHAETHGISVSTVDAGALISSYWYPQTGYGGASYVDFYPGLLEYNVDNVSFYGTQVDMPGLSSYSGTGPYHTNASIRLGSSGYFSPLYLVNGGFGTDTVPLRFFRFDNQYYTGLRASNNLGGTNYEIQLPTAPAPVNNMFWKINSNGQSYWGSGVSYGDSPVFLGLTITNPYSAWINMNGGSNGYQYDGISLGNIYDTKRWNIVDRSDDASTLGLIYFDGTNYHNFFNMEPTGYTQFMNASNSTLSFGDPALYSGGMLRFGANNVDGVSMIMVSNDAAPTDQKQWYFLAQNSDFYWGMLNDTYDSGDNYAHISRTGATTKEFDLMYGYPSQISIDDFGTNIGATMSVTGLAQYTGTGVYSTIDPTAYGNFSIVALGGPTSYPAGTVYLRFWYVDYAPDGIPTYSANSVNQSVYVNGAQYIYISATAIPYEIQANGYIQVDHSFDGVSWVSSMILPAGITIDDNSGWTDPVSPVPQSPYTYTGPMYHDSVYVNQGNVRFNNSSGSPGLFYSCLSDYLEVNTLKASKGVFKGSPGFSGSNTPINIQGTTGNPLFGMYSGSGLDGQELTELGITNWFPVDGTQGAYINFFQENNGQMAGLIGGEIDYVHQGGFFVMRVKDPDSGAFDDPLKAYGHGVRIGEDYNQPAGVQPYAELEVKNDFYTLHPSVMIINHSGQTVDLTDWTNSSRVVLSSIDYQGNGVFPTLKTATLTVSTITSSLPLLAIPKDTTITGYVSASSMTSKNGIVLTSRGKPSTEDGVLYYDSTQKNTIGYFNSLWDSIDGTIFTSTQSSQINAIAGNMVGESSFTLVGIGTYTIPANWFQPGKTIVIENDGIYTNKYSLNPLRFTLKIDTISVIDTGALSIPVATSQTYTMNGYLTCYKNGTSGQIMSQGRWIVNSGTVTASMSSNNPLPIYINTTINHNIILTGISGTAAQADQAVVMTNLIIGRKN